MKYTKEPITPIIGLLNKAAKIKKMPKSINASPKTNDNITNIS
ncbi:hypothetical protein [Tenacibaculum sp. M341]|nr:hypothetical protein [Tenacibaculum sp. M341]